MQTLSAISAEKNSTIIFPLPIDIMSHYLKDDTPIPSRKSSLADIDEIFPDPPEPKAPEYEIFPPAPPELSEQPIYAVPEKGRRPPPPPPDYPQNKDLPIYQPAQTKRQMSDKQFTPSSNQYEVPQIKCETAQQQTHVSQQLYDTMNNQQYEVLCKQYQTQTHESKQYQTQTHERKRPAPDPPRSSSSHQKSTSNDEHYDSLNNKFD